MLFRSTFLSLLLLAGLIACKPDSTHQTEAPDALQTSIEQALSSHLDAYFPRLIDTVQGGYYTNFAADWSREKQQDKMMVTQARGLWLAARASVLFPEGEDFRLAADHGFRFMTDSLWDHQQGGFSQYLQGSAPAVSPPHKFTYAHAFGMYALAAYAEISSDPQARFWLERAFSYLDSAAHDSETGGYRTFVFEEGAHPEDSSWRAEVWTLGWGAWNWKDQNTSIHVLEALAETYRVWPDSVVRNRLEEMLRLIRDTMVQPAGYLGLYFPPDWKAISHQQDGRAAIMAGLKYDHRSFGHDIETAFLLVEAAEVLYGEADARTWEVAKRMVDHSLQHGFAPGYFGLYYEGYQFPDVDTVEIVNPDKIWWAQAEAWHALGLFADHYPAEPGYQEAYQQMWRYIQAFMLDHEYGGWYEQGWDQGDSLRMARKGHAWKGGYHDGRALMQRWLAHSQSLQLKKP